MAYNSPRPAVIDPICGIKFFGSNTLSVNERLWLASQSTPALGRQGSGMHAHDETSL